MTASEIIAKVAELATSGYDVILSDMAPKTTGIRVRDHLGSAELVEKVFSLCPMLLKQGGTLIVKLFDGEERENIVRAMKAMFSNVKTIRPDATRKSSFEMYIICSGFKK
jgi:23S rRNA (uridine2552-2'-O)-methyltransferase